MKKVNSVKFRLATPDDIHLPTYDNTKLVAYNTCPTWGVMTYDMHKKMPGAGRAMPLECGAVMHEVFAWVRLCSLINQLPDSLINEEIFEFHGERLFGEKRFAEILEQLTPEDYKASCITGAIAVLETSGYYDDPSDKKRTLSNMIECALAYIHKWDWSAPVWMRDTNDPFGDVGIEIPFDIVVTMDVREYDDNKFCVEAEDKSFRYTGKIDGIRIHNGVITLEENKTAARLNDAWSMGFAMATQVTGYCIAASVFTGEQVRNADIMGLAIPLPKSYDYGGIIREPVSRKDYHFEQWINWALHTVSGYESYKDNPYEAPKYTHSCSRYFRPCSLLAFCDSEREDQEQTVKEMLTEEWSPLHEKVGD